jgi:DNA-binding CsgD family transcriptional regulator
MLRRYIPGVTVSGHLRHVFAKLGVNSRFDLARIAAGHEAER